MSVEQYKAQAKRLANRLESVHGVKLKHSSILDAIADLHGAQSWHHLVAGGGAEPSGAVPLKFTRSSHVEIRVPMQRLMDRARLPGGEVAWTLGHDFKGQPVVHRSADRTPVLLWGDRASSLAFQLRMAAQQIAAGGAVVFFDDGANPLTRDKLFAAAERAGRTADFLYLQGGIKGKANTYNPLIDGDTNSVVSRLLRVFPRSAGPNPGAEFFLNQARQALTLVLSVMRAADVRLTLPELADLLNNPSLLAQLPQIAANAGAPDLQAEAEAYLDQFRSGKAGQLDRDAVARMLGGVSARLHMLSLANWSAIEPQIRMPAVLSSKKILYVSHCASPTLRRLMLSDISAALHGKGAQERTGVPPLVLLQDAFWQHEGLEVENGLVKVCCAATAETVAKEAELLGRFLALAELAGTHVVLPGAELPATVMARLPKAASELPLSEPLREDEAWLLDRAAGAHPMQLVEATFPAPTREWSAAACTPPRGEPYRRLADVVAK